MSKIKISMKEKEFLNISEYIDAEIRNSDKKEGLCIVTVKNPAAALLLAENSEDVLSDISEELERLLPPRTNYLSEVSPYEAAGQTMAALLSQSKELIYTDKQRQNKTKDVFVYTMSVQNTDINIMCI